MIVESNRSFASWDDFWKAAQSGEDLIGANVDFEQFKQDYPSAVIQGKTIVLSQSDYLQLLKDVGTAAPENVLSFFYQGYAIEKESADTKQKPKP